MTGTRTRDIPGSFARHRARAAWAAWVAGPPPRPFGRSLSGAAVGAWGLAAYARAEAAQATADEAEQART